MNDPSAADKLPYIFVPALRVRKDAKAIKLVYICLCPFHDTTNSEGNDTRTENMSSKYDNSRWESSKAILDGKPSTPGEVSIHYIRCEPPKDIGPKGTILLIHGFPQTSYQFRHVITPLADAGYRVIAPDYRGAGQSSKPRTGYDKVTMATDLHTLVTKHLSITEKVHVVGHDIGGMIAHGYGTRFADSCASLIWGECPLPGTKVYERLVKEEAHGGLWHFVFHWQIDIPEMLTQGKERQYIKSFYDRLCINALAIDDHDVDVYAKWFRQPGAMRSGFDCYRAFHQDAKDNAEWVKENGKGKVPSLVLSGAGSFLHVGNVSEEQNTEMHENTETATIIGSGHWCAEENPPAFVEEVLKWARKYPSDK